MKLIYLLFVIPALYVLPAFSAAPIGDCGGTPDDAVMELPAPLSDWGVIVCTPHGHIISNREGWIWSNPGGYSPVFIPSQMVRRNPEPLGNKSYFTNIVMTDVTGTPEAEAVWKLLTEKFDQSEKPEKVYFLDVDSTSGKQLSLYFFTSPGGPHLTGIWCPNSQCRADSFFMVLDMRDTE